MAPGGFPPDGSPAGGASADDSPVDGSSTADRSSRRVTLDTPLHSDAIPDSVRCPFCGESETEQFSAFGSALSVSQYYCRRCRTVFEWMKHRAAARSESRSSR